MRVKEPFREVDVVVSGTTSKLPPSRGRELSCAVLRKGQETLSYLLDLNLFKQGFCQIKHTVMIPYRLLKNLGQRAVEEQRRYHNYTSLNYINPCE